MASMIGKNSFWIISGGKASVGSGCTNLADDEVVEPAVEELHDVRALAGRNGGGDLRLVVGIREGRVLDRDARIGRLEALDQLIHRLDAGVEHVLPVLDLDGLRRPGREQADAGHEAEQHSSEAAH